jgi:hypothetical protein
MKLQKFQVSKNKQLINYKFYCILKALNSVPKLNDKEVSLLLETYYANKELLKIGKFENLKFLLLKQITEFNKIKNDKLEKFSKLISENQNKLELEVFIFSLKLIQIKPLLTEEAKLSQLSEVFKLEGVNQLSIKYDNISKTKPYVTRVNGALLSLLFFEKIESGETNFLAETTQSYLNTLCIEYQNLIKNELEPNQIFMLMLSESVNQGIVSDAGASYENRVFNILVNIGIEPETISKVHDVNDKSTEYDFFFNLKGKTFGLSAKRTLRERYKQFIKTSYSSNIDVMLEFTLGLDLTEEKAKSIRQHNVVIIVADEIYNSREYLQCIDGIYPASKLDLNLLYKLSEIK